MSTTFVVASHARVHESGCHRELAVSGCAILETAPRHAAWNAQRDQLRPNAEGEWPAPFEFAGKPCVLVRTPDGEIKAFNAICTHTDCTVKYRPEEGDIFCTCHSGVYDLNGRNISGPPPRPLESYKVSLRGKPGQEEIIVSRA